MAISDLEYLDNSDATLIRRTRAGDTDAYGLLFERHRSAAMALAWRLSRSASDADDLVAEGSAKVLSVLLRGRGPDTAFRPYLLSTIRRLAYDRTDFERREAPVEDRDFAAEIDLTDPVLDDFERTTAAAAFASLPERWRMVLWHTEVEGQSPAEVAVLLDMKPNAVAALAYRAREGLRQAYLTNHAVADPTGDRECRRTNDRLAAYIRGGLAPTHEAQVRRHLGSCDHCQAAYLELTQVNSAMRSVIAALVLGPAAGAYLAELAAPTVPALVGGAHLGVAGHLAGGTAQDVASSGSRLLHVLWGNPVTAGAAAAVMAVGIGAAAMVAGSNGTDVAATTRPGAGRVVTTTAVVPTTAGGRRVDTAGRSTTTAPRAAEPAPTLPRPVAPAEPATPVPPTEPVAPPVAPVVPTAPVEPITPTTSVTPTTIATTTTTSTPASSTTTTTSAPVVPSRLEVDLDSAGGMVSGRPGVIVATLDNAGLGRAADVRVVISLRSMTVRRAPVLPTETVDAATSAPGGGSGAWRCAMTSSTEVTCRADAVQAGDHEAVYLPVSVPAGVSLVGADLAVSGQNVDPDHAGLHRRVEMPVELEGMAARFATIDHGGVTGAGAGLLTCAIAEPGCEDAGRRSGPLLDNGSFVMEPVDVDGDPATAVSARAQLDLPSGATVSSAQLYWGGDLTEGLGGLPAPDPELAGRVTLAPPSSSGVSVVAERVDRVGSRYQAVADVTDLVAAHGEGAWLLADAQLGTGRNRFGGWSLVVAYRSPSAPRRSIVVLDGLREVTAGSSTAFDVGGFVVPGGSSGSASILVQAYDGDAGLVGDQLSVGGHPLVDPANPPGDSFNATISDRGILAQGAGALANTFGFDLDRFDLDGVLPPGSIAARVEASTDADVYLPGVVAIEVDQ